MLFMKTVSIDDSLTIQVCLYEIVRLWWLQNYDKKFLKYEAFRPFSGAIG